MEIFTMPPWHTPLHHASKADSPEEDSEPLIEKNDVDSEPDAVPSNAKYLSKALWSRVLVIFLLSTNLALLLHLWRQSDRCSVPHERSRFANLEHNTQVVYRNWSDHQSPDRRVQIEAWKSVDTMPLEVMYSDSEALKLGIPIADKRFPWDDSIGIYTPKAVHDIHCLKSIHRAFRNLEVTGGPAPPEAVHHLYHCLDTLRQNVMCSADETPMALTPGPDVISDYQTQTCRDWNQLVEWARSPARNPCYRRAMVPFQDDIIQFLWCEEASPYRERQRQYFNEFGHLHREDIENQGWDFDESLQ